MIRLVILARAPGIGSRLCFHGATPPLQGFTQQPFDLPIDAAQFLSGERLDRRGNRGIEAQQKCLAVGWLRQTTRLRRKACQS
jgi:hypothetical protein